MWSSLLTEKRVGIGERCEKVRRGGPGVKPTMADQLEDNFLSSGRGLFAKSVMLGKPGLPSGCHPILSTKAALKRSSCKYKHVHAYNCFVM